MYGRHPVGVRAGSALALAIALTAACSSSSGPSTFSGPGDDGSTGGSSGGSSSGGLSLGTIPLCPGCSADGGSNGPSGGVCPMGWTATPSCKCYLAGVACNDPVADCQGLAAQCLPEALLDGAGNRCHCSCPSPMGVTCGS